MSNRDSFTGLTSRENKGLTNPFNGNTYADELIRCGGEEPLREEYGSTIAQLTRNINYWRAQSSEARANPIENSPQFDEHGTARTGDGRIWDVDIDVTDGLETLQTQRMQLLKLWAGNDPSGFEGCMRKVQADGVIEVARASNYLPAGRTGSDDIQLNTLKSRITDNAEYSGYLAGIIQSGVWDAMWAQKGADYSDTERYLSSAASYPKFLEGYQEWVGKDMRSDILMGVSNALNDGRPVLTDPKKAAFMIRNPDSGIDDDSWNRTKKYNTKIDFESAEAILRVSGELPSLELLDTIHQQKQRVIAEVAKSTVVGKADAAFEEATVGADHTPSNPDKLDKREYAALIELMRSKGVAGSPYDLTVGDFQELCREMEAAKAGPTTDKTDGLPEEGRTGTIRGPVGGVGTASRAATIRPEEPGPSSEGPQHHRGAEAHRNYR